MATPCCLLRTDFRATAWRFWNCKTPFHFCRADLTAFWLHNKMVRSVETTLVWLWTTIFHFWNALLILSIIQCSNVPLAVRVTTWHTRRCLAERRYASLQLSELGSIIAQVKQQQIVPLKSVMWKLTIHTSSEMHNLQSTILRISCHFSPLTKNNLTVQTKIVKTNSVKKSRSDTDPVVVFDYVVSPPLIKGVIDGSSGRKLVNMKHVRSKRLKTSSLVNKTIYANEHLLPLREVFVLDWNSSTVSCVAASSVRAHAFSSASSIHSHSRLTWWHVSIDGNRVTSYTHADERSACWSTWPLSP